MSGIRFNIQVLTPEHDTSRFDCGDARRNAWLSGRALANKANDYSQTYIGLLDGRVTGFYSLSASSLARSTLPSSARHGAPDPVSMVLLGQLGVDRSLQGNRMGDQLVSDAFRRVVRAADLIGCRLMGVHPADDWLIRYYEGFGFRHVAGITPSLMLITVPTLRKLLA